MLDIVRDNTCMFWHIRNIFNGSMNLRRSSLHLVEFGYSPEELRALRYSDPG